MTLFWTNIIHNKSISDTVTISEIRAIELAAGRPNLTHIGLTEQWQAVENIY